MKRAVSILLLLSLSSSVMAALPKPCQKAYILSQKEHFTQAHTVGDQKKCPLLMTYIKWLELRYKDNNASFMDHYHFLQKHPDWPFLHQIKKNMEGRAPKGLSGAELKAWFQKNPPTTSEGVATYAKLLRKYGAEGTAAKLIRSFWKKNLRDGDASKKFLKHHQKTLRPEDHKIRLETLLWEGKAKLAKPLLKHLKKGPRAVAEARIALQLNDKKNLRKALHRVPRSLKNTEGLLYDRVKWHRRFQEKKGLDFYQSVRKHIETHLNQWIKEKHIIVRDAIRHKQYKKAYKLVTSHSFTPGTGAYAEAEWLAGFLAYNFLKDSKASLRHFERILGSSKMVMSLSQAAYWGAKAQKKLGNPKRRIAWLKKAANHSMSYYGQLACKELNINTCLYLKETSGIPASMVTTMRQHKFMPIIKLLKELGDSHKSIPFLYLMYKRAKGKKQKLAVVEIARTDCPEAIVELLEIYEKKNTFPIKWAYPLLKDIQWRKGIDKALIHAIIRKESKFNPRVESWAGAIGIMQIMPRTGAGIAKKLNFKNFTANELYTKEVNLRFGQYYVEESLDRFKGNIPMMLAAYNAGHGNVNNKWVKRFGDPRTNHIHMDTWIELISFPETRFYVKKVMGYYRIYQHLLK